MTIFLERLGDSGDWEFVGRRRRGEPEPLYADMNNSIYRLLVGESLPDFVPQPGERGLPRDLSRPMRSYAKKSFTGASWSWMLASELALLDWSRPELEELGCDWFPERELPRLLDAVDRVAARYAARFILCLS